MRIEGSNEWRKICLLVSLNNKKHKVTIRLYFVSEEHGTVIKKLLFLGLLSCGVVTLQAVVAVGDTADSSTTFQFSVGSHVPYGFGLRY